MFIHFPMLLVSLLLRKKKGSKKVWFSWCISLRLFLPWWYDLQGTSGQLLSHWSLLSWGRVPSPALSEQQPCKLQNLSYSECKLIWWKISDEKFSLCEEYFTIANNYRRVFLYFVGQFFSELMPRVVTAQSTLNAEINDCIKHTERWD